MPAAGAAALRRAGGPVRVCRLAGAQDAVLDGATLTCLLRGEPDQLLKAAARHQVLRWSAQDRELEDLYGCRPPGQPPQLKVCTSNTPLRATITATTPEASTVVTRWFTRSPIRAWWAVNRTNGTNAKGNPKDSTTCDSTSA